MNKLGSYISKLMTTVLDTENDEFVKELALDCTCLICSNSSEVNFCACFTAITFIILNYLLFLYTYIEIRKTHHQCQ